MKILPKIIYYLKPQILPHFTIFLLNFIKDSHKPHQKLFYKEKNTLAAFRLKSLMLPGGRRA